MKIKAFDFAPIGLNKDGGNLNRSLLPFGCYPVFSHIIFKKGNKTVSQ